MLTTLETPFSTARGWLQRQGSAYRNGADRPLGGYLALMGAYVGGTVSASLLARSRGQQRTNGFSAWELAQLTLATQRIARLISKDPVTSPFRSPFTQYSGLSSPGELAEEVRGHGLQHSVGELLSCPMCLSQWVATTLAFGLILVPAPTRLVLGTFSAVAGADLLQHVYVRVQQSTDQDSD